jgi:hypothetical protein
MKAILRPLLVLLILACLSWPTANEISLGQLTARSETPKRHVYKNEDLEKYQEKYGSETQAPPMSKSAVTSSNDQNTNQNQDNKGKPKPDLAIWRTKLKEINDTIAVKKRMESKLSGSLAKYSQNLAQADTDFNKMTAQLQVAGVQENLARTQTELKKAEEDKATLLSNAKKAGIEEEDLLKTESPNETKK